MTITHIPHTKYENKTKSTEAQGLILGGPETQMAPELHRKAELLAEAK